MCVCVCVYIYDVIFVCLYVSACMYASTSMYVCIYIYVCVCVYIYIYMHASMLAYVTGNRVIRLEEISVGEGLVSSGSGNIIAASDNQFSLRCKEAAVRYIVLMDSELMGGVFFQ